MQEDSSRDSHPIEAMPSRAQAHEQRVRLWSNVENGRLENRSFDIGDSLSSSPQQELERQLEAKTSILTVLYP